MINGVANKINQFTVNSNKLSKPVKEIKAPEVEQKDVKEAIKHPDNKGLFIDAQL